MATLSTPVVETAPVRPRKFGLLRNLRRKKKSPVVEESVQENDTKDANTSDDTDRLSVEELVDVPLQEEEEEKKTKMKAVRFPFKDAFKSKLPIRKEMKLEKAPAAREAAFGGPPRYDWIDIETSAAIKVQSVFRRNQTMARLEQEGITTSVIRNRSRRRQARLDHANAASADMPDLFACCGVGLAFGDATEEDYDATRQHQRDEYYQRKEDKEKHEEVLRKRYTKNSTQKKLASRGKVEESLEVVE